MKKDTLFMNSFNCIVITITQCSYYSWVYAWLVIILFRSLLEFVICLALFVGLKVNYIDNFKWIYSIWRVHQLVFRTIFQYVLVYLCG